MFSHAWGEVKSKGNKTRNYIIDGHNFPTWTQDNTLKTKGVKSTCKSSFLISIESTLQLRVRILLWDWSETVTQNFVIYWQCLDITLSAAFLLHPHSIINYCLCLNSLTLAPTDGCCGNVYYWMQHSLAFAMASACAFSAMALASARVVQSIRGCTK